MAKPTPDHHDAELVLRVYDLRREPVMREARSAINGQFWPKSYDDVAAVLRVLPVGRVSPVQAAVGAML